MPTLQGALLCDAARDYNGLVSVLGGFVSILVVPDLPVPAPVMFAGRVGFSNAELLEEHHIVARTIGEPSPGTGMTVVTVGYARGKRLKVVRSSADPDLVISAYWVP